MNANIARLLTNWIGSSHAVDRQGVIPLEDRLLESFGYLKVGFCQIVGLSDIFGQVVQLRVLAMNVAQ